MIFLENLDLSVLLLVYEIQSGLSCALNILLLTEYRLTLMQMQTTLFAITSEFSHKIVGQGILYKL